MHSGKCNLAAHASREHPDSATCSLLCSEAPQTFKHSILSCPTSARQRSRLLQGISDLTPEAPIWSDQQLLLVLAEFNRPTATGFPPGMPPLAPSLHTPPPNLLRQSNPPIPPCPSRLVKRFILSLILATAALRHLLVALGELVMFVSFVDC